MQKLDYSVVFARMGSGMHSLSLSLSIYITTEASHKYTHVAMWNISLRADCSWGRRENFHSQHDCHPLSISKAMRMIYTILNWSSLQCFGRCGWYSWWVTDHHPLHHFLHSFISTLLLFVSLQDCSCLNNDGTSPLHYLVRRLPEENIEEEIYIETLQEMVAKGADVNAQTKLGKLVLTEWSYSVFYRRFHSLYVKEQKKKKNNNNR